MRICKKEWKILEWNGYGHFKFPQLAFSGTLGNNQTCHFRRLDSSVRKRTAAQASRSEKLSADRYRRVAARDYDQVGQDEVSAVRWSVRRRAYTMPNWAGSSWYYYLRYLPILTTPASWRRVASSDYWTPVDWYNGGMEHTVLHLLYSRFWHKFLYDIGIVPTVEPYSQNVLRTVSILAADGEKMSKSRGNVVNPDGLVEIYGADSVRLYEMFMGPFDQAVSWQSDSIIGTRNFLERVWRFHQGHVQEQASGKSDAGTKSGGFTDGEDAALKASLNLMIKKA